MENKTAKLCFDTEQQIKEECDAVAQMLIGKNRAYGDSALTPRRIFSRSDSLEQLKVRIDDKLSRLASTEGDVDVMGENVEEDLTGYLILLRIARKRKKLLEKHSLVQPREREYDCVAAEPALARD